MLAICQEIFWEFDLYYVHLFDSPTVLEIRIIIIISPNLQMKKYVKLRSHIVCQIS